MQYDADGHQTTLLSGLGSKRIMNYDPLSRLTTLIEQNAASSPISTIIDTYDAVGRKTVQTRDGVPTTYSYDNAGRLTGQTKADRVATFAYDGVGNTTSKQHHGQQPMTLMYDTANRLTTIQDGPTLVSFVYDANGNMTLEDRATVQTGYVYDQENRMTKINHPDGTFSTFTYAGNDLRRTKQEHGTGVVTYIWDGEDYLGELS